MQRLLGLGLALCLCFISTFAFADGTEVPYGTRAVTMGKTFTAIADDVSTIYWNPAGLTQLTGQGVAIDYMNLKTDESFKEDTNYPLYSAGDNTFTAANKAVNLLNPAYYYALDKMTIAFGMYAMSGLAENFTQTDIKMGSYIGLMNVGPVIGYKVSDDLSVGAGLGLVLAKSSLQGSLDINPAILPARYEDFSLNSSGTNWNANLGVLYKVNSDLKVGTSYRLPQRIILKGKSKYLGTEKDFTTFTNIPGKFNLGAAYTWPQVKGLMSSIEMSVTQWNKALLDGDIDFEDPVLDSIGALSNRAELNARNNLCLSIGSEYKINEQLTARIGLMNEGPETISGDKIQPVQYLVKFTGYGLGMSYDLGQVGINLGYVFLQGGDLNNGTTTLHPWLGNINANTGTYKNYVSIVMLGVAVKL
ncbi:MAG: outer membrane protein transport protein [Elusimicrobia bacterium]|nr:outer membrane protein transport protein [Elusimicrobiota bacterium]